MATTQSKAFWCFDDQSQEITEWIPYSNIECEIIEDAFNIGQDKVELDSCIIDFIRNIQIDKYNETMQHNIKRLTSVQQRKRVETDRFSVVEPLKNQTFADSDDGGNFRGFAWEWYEKQFQPDEPKLLDIVEKAANGILIEGKLCSNSVMAKRMAQKLLEIKQDDKIIISKYCLEFYTEECFLYKMVNKTLRETDRTKFDTLGPYCYLLKYVALLNLFPVHIYENIVYRSVHLEKEEIDQYRNAINDPQLKQWLSFTSTTKNRKVAEFFQRNTLFIIQPPINRYSFGMDISSYSMFPDEEEVLFPTQICFKVEKVELNQEKNKTIIYLNMDLSP